MGYSTSVLVVAIHVKTEGDRLFHFGKEIRKFLLSKLIKLFWVFFTSQLKKIFHTTYYLDLNNFLGNAATTLS